MNLRKASVTIHDEIIELYKNKTIEALKAIKFKWAYGKDVDKILDHTQNPVANLYTIFIVSTRELILNAVFNEVTCESLFTDNLVNNARIAKTLSRWEKGLYVDPPTVFLSQHHKNKIEFSDGRHRAKITYLLDHKEIPIAVANCDIPQISNIINIKKT